MKKYLMLTASAAILLSMGLTSCETPVGQGAGFGAATGAIIGGAATGHFRGAAIGAGAGALAGALVGAAIEEDQRQNYHAPPGGYPYARPTDTPGYVYSPYAPHNVIDVRGVPHGAWVRDTSTGGIFIRP
ncbi:MAG TPA: glycine zipper domain-containing protein [Chthoniobacterales bacterium]